MSSGFCSLFGEFLNKLGESLYTIFSYGRGLFFIFFPGDLVFCSIVFLEVVKRGSLKSLLEVFVLEGFCYLSFLFFSGETLNPLSLFFPDKIGDRPKIL